MFSVCAFVLATTLVVITQFVTARYTTDLRAARVEIAARSAAAISLKLLKTGHVPSNTIYHVGDVLVTQTVQVDTTVIVEEVASGNASTDKIKYSYDTIEKVILYWGENLP